MKKGAIKAVVRTKIARIPAHNNGDFIVAVSVGAQVFLSLMATIAAADAPHQPGPTQVIPSIEIVCDSMRTQPKIINAALTYHLHHRAHHVLLSAR